MHDLGMPAPEQFETILIHRFIGSLTRFAGTSTIRWSLRLAYG